MDYDVATGDAATWGRPESGNAQEQHGCERTNEPYCLEQWEDGQCEKPKGKGREEKGRKERKKKPREGKRKMRRKTEGKKQGKKHGSSDSTLFSDRRSMQFSPQPQVPEVDEHGHVGPFVLRCPSGVCTLGDHDVIWPRSSSTKVGT